ncbi:hypothetical protein P0Y35_06905 [Kiritimatiellaeota bacterium B1221]|nr:hypothetical protein [Kiritimatiellaeota bacterium B1221]
MDTANNDFWLRLFREEGGDFFRTLAGGTLQGLGLSVVFIFVIYFLFRILHLLPKRGGGAVKVITAAWLIVTVPLAGGFMGFHQSLEKAINGLMVEGRFAREVMPELSVAISDFIFLLDARMAEALAEEMVPPDAETLNVTVFEGRMEKMQETWLPKIVESSADAVRLKYPFLQEGIPQQLFDGFVSLFAEKGLKSQIASTADQVGIRFPLTVWVEGLPDVAQMTGAADDLTRSELSGYTVQTLLRAFFLQPMALLLKIQQWIGGLALVLIVIVPATLLGLVKKFRKPSGVDVR